MNLSKILGSLIIMISLFSYGFIKNINMLMSIKTNKDFEIFLINLKIKIQITSKSIQEIIDSSIDDFSLKFKSNKGDLNNFCYNNFANRIDFENNRYFFENLGKTDKNSQILAIEIQLEICRKRIEEEEKIYREKSKINLIFYSFVGVIIVMIFV